MNMEDFEKRHITANISALIELTRCHVRVLAGLEESLLHRGEIEILESLKINSERAYEMYKMVKTKIRGYAILKEVLYKTKNSGAYDILDKCNKHNHSTQFRNGKTITTYKPRKQHTGYYKRNVFKGLFEKRVVLAVKTEIWDEKDSDMIINEVELLLKIDWHANMVRHYKTEIRDEYVVTALELCTWNLRKFVGNRGNYCVEMRPVIIDILKQAAKGVGFLHRSNIVHKNLNPDNLLILKKSESAPVCVRICNFAFAHQSNEETVVEAENVNRGPIDWMAPEVIKQIKGRFTTKNVTFTRKADIFALGCIYYFILTGGVHPFGKEEVSFWARLGNIEADQCKINENDVDFAVFGDPTNFMWLIRHMISHREVDRPTISNVLDHHAFWSRTTENNFLRDVLSWMVTSFTKNISQVLCNSLLCVGEGVKNSSGENCGIKKIVKKYSSTSIEECIFAKLLSSFLQHHAHSSENVLESFSKFDPMFKNWEKFTHLLVPITWTVFKGLLVKTSVPRCIEQYYNTNLETNCKFGLIKNANAPKENPVHIPTIYEEYHEIRFSVKKKVRNGVSSGTEDRPREEHASDNNAQCFSSTKQEKKSRRSLPVSEEEQEKPKPRKTKSKK